MQHPTQNVKTPGLKFSQWKEKIVFLSPPSIKYLILRNLEEDFALVVFHSYCVSNGSVEGPVFVAKAGVVEINGTWQEHFFLCY
jgi:hypothetical protein